MRNKQIVLATVPAFSLFFLGVMSTSSELMSLYPYDPWLDNNDDGIIDIFDAIILAGHFGESW